MSRHVLICLAGCLVASLPLGTAYAALKTLSNHSYSPGNPGLLCVSGYVPGPPKNFEEFEMFATKFVAQPGDYPFTIKKIRVFACGGGITAWAVDLWHDNEDASPNPDATLYVGNAYAIAGTNAMTEIDLSSANIQVASGGVRVGLTYVGSGAPPGVGADLDGIHAARNFIRHYPPPLTWYFAENVGVTGDFIVEIDIDTPGTSGVSDPTSAFGLRGVTPNPFTRATRVDFALAQPGETRLEVVDISGRRVCTLASGWRPAGPDQIVWDGRDSEGRRIAAGIYVVRLREGPLEAVRKIVMVP